ncbi:TetR/AcrR family transcriptional regulator [Pseudonocardia sp. KRD291]|uniref:TetR/AcrR family transcriptional regulator n=1 Tax=Pseudonocardia sp. KRD291 TaxID=2792007 RepID=UPI001C49D6D0|nr:TetR/AcrR family transcriptional regulator [Pseudonocardia sp. KRD291]MBW0105186.1 TetR/AcrR family transcriptional regulator [Pseudonocardia sp. KRD291]
MPGQAQRDTDGQAGLRARKKARTRQALRSAALARARAQGPDGFTLQEVCDDAEVSARTFFNYYPGKDAVLFDWDEDMVAALTAAVRDRPAGEDPATAVLTVVEGLVAALTTNPLWHEQIELLRAYPELAPRMASVEWTVEDTLVRALAERAGRPVDDLAARTAASVAMAALRVTVTTWLADPAGPDSRTVFRRVLEHTRALFGPAPDRAAPG